MKKILISTCTLALLFLSGCAHQNLNRDEVVVDETDYVMTTDDSCTGAVDCVTDAESCKDYSDDKCYGGVKQEYVVKGCKVTIYDNGPVRMVHEKTGQFCNAPIPEDHDFGSDTRIYTENGCTVTEQVNRKTGLSTASMDCP